MISSGSERRIASAVRSGSVVGIAGGSSPSKRTSSPRSNARKARLTSRTTCDVGDLFASPNAITCEINSTCARLICARSNSASAIVRAHSRVTTSMLAPAMLRASRSIRLLRSAVAVAAAARPWRKEFRPDLFLPAPERGPVLRRALRRLAAICRSVATDHASSGGGSFETSSSARTSPSISFSAVSRSCRLSPPRNSAKESNALSKRHSRDANSRSSFSRSAALIRIASASIACSSRPK